MFLIPPHCLSLCTSERQHSRVAEQSGSTGTVPLCRTTQLNDCCDSTVVVKCSHSTTTQSRVARVPVPLQCRLTAGHSVTLTAGAEQLKTGNFPDSQKKRTQYKFFLNTGNLPQVDDPQENSY